jgi:hypothetical protein
MIGRNRINLFLPYTPLVVKDNNDDGDVKDVGS